MSRNAPNTPIQSQRLRFGCGQRTEAVQVLANSRTVPENLSLGVVRGKPGARLGVRCNLKAEEVVLHDSQLIQPDLAVEGR
jgi:hypothetical protein